MEQLTPMMKQYLDIKNQHRDKLVFFRLGDFYELFFDDAKIASKELEITLTGRDCGQAERAPMCGVPYHSVDSYIAKLISKNYKIAICEQVEDPQTAKGIVKREITRIITPGTIIDSTMLCEYKNNFLMCIYKGSKNISISYVDLSTGDFLNTFIKPSELNLLIDEINRIRPSEIICNDEFNKEALKSYNVDTFNKSYFDYKECEKIIKSQYNIVDLIGLGIENDSQIKSCGILLKYLNETQKSSLSHIKLLKVYSISSFMKIDANTRRNLELSETIIEKNKKGSLLSVLDKTVTSMGSRKLIDWVEKPLISIEDINKRLEGVDELFDNYLIREEIKEYLKTVYDIERLGAKVSLGTANARDLISLKNSITNIPHIKAHISTLNCSLIHNIYCELDELIDIHDIIENAIQEDPPFSVKEGNIIKLNYDCEIDKYKEILKNGKNWIIELEQNEKIKTGIKNLKVGYNRVFGYYIDITKANISLVPDYYIRKQTLSNCERYITPELKELESNVIGAEEKLLELEYNAFIQVRLTIAAQIKRIQKTAEMLSILDCLCSFAEVAQKNRYIKPNIDDSDTILIKEGRHPVVECQSIETAFVPNDTFLDTQENSMIIITGPNMAGKSTYMRQVALITLMAQIGSFVPAKEASIGIVDRIFTRVGASDDLASGRSTFMVEMSELANIINNATKKSLIILDEIGRGTSTFDGLSIAWSVVEYMSDREKLGAKTLFATHYHELTELENKINGVKNYCISVEEQGRDIVFLRKIKRGNTTGSYGIHVARLAGISDKIIKRAYEILSILEKSEQNNNMSIYSDIKKSKNSNSNSQIDIFDCGSQILADMIKDIDLDSLTPIQALNKLYEIKETVKAYFDV